MPRRILLINSDLAANRGDRAIAEGNIQIIREHFPDAEVVGLSQHAERDGDWYGATFLDMDFQSLDPRDLVRLVREARASDLVLWGGGEILKDYTNKAALWYWVAKMSVISLANPNVVGAFQGIGPTGAALSRRLIGWVVNRTRAFIVRDGESGAKARAWGADPAKVIEASDPAVLSSPEPLSATTLERLRETFDIDEAFLDDMICIGPRDWFHYRPGGLLPYKYARRIPLLRRRAAPAESADHEAYVASLRDLVSEVVTRFDVNVLLAPMHLAENDAELCHLLRRSVEDRSRVRVLDRDVLSPAEFRSVLARARAMVGFRLHSNIVGISSGVPCVNVYYVDKGRVFFDQIGQSRYAVPIERALEPDFVPHISGLLGDLLGRDREVREEIATATARLRDSIRQGFTEALQRVGTPS